MKAKLIPNEIRQGDIVWWRGSEGRDGWLEAKVKRIELVRPGQHENGVLVPWIPTTVIDNCVFDLDNGHWAYGYQIKPKEETI
jgi:hypothetical protein